jgi:hypothetical protein
LDDDWRVAWKLTQGRKVCVIHMRVRQQHEVERREFSCVQSGLYETART